MSKQRLSPSNRSIEPHCWSKTPGPLQENGLSREQFHRLAELISDGQVSLCKDRLLNPNDPLVNEVRNRGREKLIRLIAKAIAHELYGSGLNSKGS